MTFSNVISAPYVADKKSFPVRWVVVALCAMAACVLSILVAYVLEHKNNKAE